MADLKEDLLKKIDEAISDFADDEKAGFLEDLIGELESRVSELIEENEGDEAIETEAEENDNDT